MRDQLSLFVKKIDKTLQHVSQALTATRPVTISCADINAALHALAETETSRQPLQESSVAEQSFLVKEAEQIVRTIEIISQLLPISNREREGAAV
jgi:hypothetical protein